MNAASFSFGVIILCSITTLSLTKPFVSEEKNFGDEKLRCMDSENSIYEKNNQYPFTDFYNKPSQSRLEGTDKYKTYDYNEKRSISDEFQSVAKPSTAVLQKRQVGVVYKNEQPIGILQPFQRSYRFIPVNEDSSYDVEDNNLPYNVPIKREADDDSVLDKIYPSILTDFKIGSKLDKKRNYNAFTDENVRELKSTIRRLRSANSHNTEQIEEKLKNILNDMGLIDDEEVHAKKRETIERPKEEDDESLLGDEPKSSSDKNKRDDSYAINAAKEASSKIVNNQDLSSSDVKKRAIKDESSDLKRENEMSANSQAEISRQKRQKLETPSALKDGTQLSESLKESGDLINANPSSLDSISNIVTRNVETDKPDEKISDDEEDYEKRVERQIQSKINTLKEEVNRELETLKKKQTDEEDTQRKKRQVVENLVDEEKEELNPVKNIDQELKPLIRKRRSTAHALLANSTKSHSRRKRDIGSSFGGSEPLRNKLSSQVRSSEKKYHTDPEGENLLGEEFEDGSITKREIDDEEYRDVNRENLEDLYERDKRSRLTPNAELYDRYLDSGNYYYDMNDRYKRQNKIGRKRFAYYQPQARLRRRINEDQAVENRPQQLSDMSDLDLFGALPKSYSGELSRYKRVKRK